MQKTPISQKKKRMHLICSAQKINIGFGCLNQTNLWKVHIDNENFIDIVRYERKKYGMVEQINNLFEYNDRVHV